MKKINFLFLLVLLPLVANADAVEIGGIYYNLNEEGHTAEVTANPNKYSGAVIIPAEITYNTTVYGVTSIGELAFYGCSGLTSVTIPNGVTSIGELAFCNCSDLRKVIIPSTVSTISIAAFSDCCSLEEINLPEGLTAIEGSAFSRCFSLKKVIIPTTVTRIGTVFEKPGDETLGPFWLCSLNTLIVPSSVQTIGQYGLCVSSETIIIMESGTPPTSIDEMPLTDALNTPLYSKIIVPDGSKTAYQNANIWKDYKDDIFEMSESSVRVLNVATAGKLPDKISEQEKYSITDLVLTGKLNGTDFRLLRDMAGNNYLGKKTNGKLKYLDISGVDIVAGGDYYLDTDKIYFADTEDAHNNGTFHCQTQNDVIGRLMFGSCQKLEEIVLPQNTTTIEDMAFWFCRNLQSIVIPANVSSIGGGVFVVTDKLTNLEVAYDNQTFSTPANSNVIMKGTKLLYGCKNSQIPSETTIIGEGAFVGCVDLNMIALPKNLKTIEYAAFQDCLGLSTITIPKSVTTIDNSAFSGCHFTSVVVEATTPIAIDNTVFSFININQNTTLFVPEGCKAVYEAAPYWNNFKSIVELVLPKAITGLAYTGAAQDLITAGPFETMKYSLTGNNFDWNSTIPQGKDAQDYTVYYKDTDYSLSGSLKVTIAPKELTNPTILFGESYSVKDDYDHHPIEPSVYVWDGETLIPTEEYDVSYSSNTNVGTATATITDKDGGNYTVSGSATFSIGRVIEDLFNWGSHWASYVAKEDLALPTGLTAYVITSLGSLSATATQISYIPQGVPILLKRDDATTNYYQASAGTGTPPTTNLLKTFTTIKNFSNQEGYVLYKDEFVLVNENGSLPVGKVFLPANESGGASTRSIVIEGEKTTGIVSGMTNEDYSSGQWYDIQGRKLEQKPVKKGIYVLNGCKVIVK